MKMDAKCTRYLFPVTFAIVALSVVAGSFIFDHLMLHYGVARGARLLVSSGVAGILAGTVCLQMQIRAREQQQIRADRLTKLRKSTTTFAMRSPWLLITARKRAIAMRSR
jgi:hypothetical protein